MVRLRILLLVVAFWAQRCCAQAPGWTAGQNSTQMCYWQSPRVGVVRDTVYLDGGDLWWLPGYTDGRKALPGDNDNIYGYVYALNFSRPFSTTSDFNQTALFTNFTESGGTSRTIGPVYTDGAMFTNDYELWIYGGLTQNTSTYTPQPADYVAVYGVYPSAPGQAVGAWKNSALDSGTTRYTAYGAGVSVPSENLGFYFSGTTSKSGGPIYFPALNGTNADFPTSRMIEVEMDVVPPGGATWSNHSIGSDILPRSGASLAWVPVSEKGILVAIGGVTEIVYSDTDGGFDQSTANKIAASSTAFTDSVGVYDIATGKWYNQKTVDSPHAAWAQGCTVVASAADMSSHNIYWYGGFDGTSTADPFFDFVWVLSLPSFKWVRLSQGDAAHARASHSCVKPYPDQMFVVGGISAQPGAGQGCLQDGIIQVFNLSSGKWQDKYDPSVWSEYQVPEAVVSAIGGNGSGHATVTTPPKGSTPTMTSILASTYATSKITTWYPYAEEASPTSNAPSTTPKSKSSGTPKYLAPVLAVVLGLFFITLVILGFLLWRRRRYLSTNQSESGTLDTRFRVSKWLRGTPSDMKAPTVTTADEPVASGFKYDLLMPEAAGVQVHEMMDTSTPAELRGTGPRDTTLTETILSETGLVPISQVVPQELSSSAENPAQRPVSTGSLPRVDSPTVASSNVSADFGHARGLSEGTISVEGESTAAAEDDAGGGAIAGREVVTPQGQRPGAVSPMTPTEVAPAGHGDYLTKGADPAPESPLAVARRTSNFSEDLDERRDTR